MSARFYAANLNSEFVVIDDSQVHHLRNVMRKVIGDRVMLFDGKNVQAVAEITSMTRSTVEFKIVETQNVSCELDVEITVAMPLPKSDRVRFLIEKLTEIGVHRFVPIVSERSEFNVTSAGSDKLMRYVIESSKQCERNQLMAIGDVEQLPSFVESADLSSTRLIGLRGGDDLGSQVNSVTKFVIMIGPEGGFSDHEVDMARAQDFVPISLGPTILRMETAAIKFASILSMPR